jgi:hypothetical protein
LPSTIKLNDHNHNNKSTEEFAPFLLEKSALFIASENLAIISCFRVPSKGYSVHAVSVILKYHIKAFLPDSVRGEYCHGHLGNDAKIADCATDNSEADIPKNDFAAASTQNELLPNSI